MAILVATISTLASRGNAGQFSCQYIGIIEEGRGRTFTLRPTTTTWYMICPFRMQQLTPPSRPPPIPCIPYSSFKNNASCLYVLALSLYEYARNSTPGLPYCASFTYPSCAQPNYSSMKYPFFSSSFHYFHYTPRCPTTPRLPLLIIMRCRPSPTFRSSTNKCLLSKIVRRFQKLQRFLPVFDAVIRMHARKYAQSVHTCLTSGSCRVQLAFHTNRRTPP